MESISIQEARKLVLLSQRVPPSGQSGAALGHSLSAIEHLGYIQIDTLSVIRRAHHHTLWNRNPRYNSSHLDSLLAAGKIFEYWSHAAAYLPMKDFRYSLPRKEAIATGKEKHWYEVDRHLMKSVLGRIAAEGPLMAREFDADSKRALMNLFMQGELMIPYRVNFQKVYDLSERVLPDGVNRSMPTEEEYARFLITRYLEANGLGQPGEMTYLLKNIKAVLRAGLKEMTRSGELIQIRVEGTDYYALSSFPELLNKPLSGNTLKILSPFDNLLIQRKRTLALFGFDYQLECYVPETKRKFGYFVLPLLWDGTLVARMDCKVDRKASLLHVHSLALEPGLSKSGEFALALTKELKSFLDFNGCDRVHLYKSLQQQFGKQFMAGLMSIKV